MSIKCTDICFECKYQDCIANAAIPTPWEKEFNAEQRKLRKEKPGRTAGIREIDEIPEDRVLIGGSGRGDGETW